MAEASVITEELRNLLDVEVGPQVYEIEKGMVKKFTEAIGDSNPLWRDMAPPTFLAALLLEELFSPLDSSSKIMAATRHLTRILNGGNELEYYQPIKVGDVISVTGRLVNLRERESRAGKMFFLIMEMTYKNQNGELVAKVRNTIIRY